LYFDFDFDFCFPSVEKIELALGWEHPVKTKQAQDYEGCSDGGRYLIRDFSVQRFDSSVGIF
jgi:hypothetical protein